MSGPAPGEPAAGTTGSAGTTEQPEIEQTEATGQPQPGAGPTGERAAPANRVRSDDLAGRVAVVTGGAKGIGAGVARRLAAGGAHVLVADLDEDAGGAVADEIGGAFLRTDVRRREDLEEAVARAERTWGGVDVVHLNAGIISGTRIDELDVDRYRDIVAINLDGVVLGAAAAVPALRRRGGGTIVATASMAGVVPLAFEPFYTATKHAVVGFCRALAGLLHPEGILVQVLCPAFTDTPLIAFGRDLLVEAGVDLLAVDDVVAGFLAALDADEPGQCLAVVPGRPPTPFPFPQDLDRRRDHGDHGDNGDRPDIAERE